jgi:hypothetical protein
MKTETFTAELCDLANASRDFERAHRIWMNTNVFTEAGTAARIAKEEARKAYQLAVERAYQSGQINYQ